MNKKGFELSISTIVVLVISMSMLILGLVLVRSIFGGATEAVDDLNKGVRDSITKMFADPDKKLVIYPTARTIDLKQRDQGKGFAFSVRNIGIEDVEYKYAIEVDPDFNIKSKCNIPNKKEPDSWLDISTGSISLGRGQMMENPKLVLYTIPDNAPPCTIPYIVTIRYKDGGNIYISDTVYLTIKPRT